MFEVIARDGLARVCRLTTDHGTLETPALLPVINPHIRSIPADEIYESMGFRAIIVNSYIIRNDPLLKEEALRRGLHDMIGFPGIIMTDSGTFQSHVYGEVNVDNREIVEFQREIGSDIGTVLDIFTEPQWGREETERAVKITLKRTEEAVSLKGGMMLAGVVQGSLFPDLRERCAREMSNMAVDVHPIGGVVPLMESYRFSDLIDVIVASKKGLIPSRPVHLFGAGHPMLFSIAALLGCDMFDSASYAKFANDERFMMVDGTVHLEDLKLLDCRCPACRNHSIESLLSMNAEERKNLIARHNLWISKMEIDRVKRAILEGEIWELAERRCRAHPELLSALRKLKKYSEYLERFEPLSRNRALFYTGPETTFRPSFLRYERRLMRFRAPGRDIIIAEDRGKPYSRYHTDLIAREYGKSTIIVNSPFGPVPLELDEIYPIAQSLFPSEKDIEIWRREEELLNAFREKLADTGWMGEGIKGSGQAFLDFQRVRNVVEYQFGQGISDILLDGKVEIEKSKITGKIRTVRVNGAHILSMRASDGFFTLKEAGARKILEKTSPPRLRIIVQEDSVPFNREGKNVFCRFVIDADENLVPMDEVIVVDENDELVAIGRTLLTREEMLAFEKGIAVKVREGIKIRCS